MNKEGRLSFERFCAGLKISILRHDEERSKTDKRNKVKGTLCTCTVRTGLVKIVFLLLRLIILIGPRDHKHASCFQCAQLPGSATSTDDPSASSSSNDDDLDSWSAASAINRAASLPNLIATNGSSSALSLARISDFLLVRLTPYLISDSKTCAEPRLTFSGQISWNNCFCLSLA